MKGKGFPPREFSFPLSVLREKFRVEPEDVGVVKGGTAKLICSPPRGTPIPTVFWKKDGRVIEVEKDKRYVHKKSSSLVN